jgi:hypothetical protein
MIATAGLLAFAWSTGVLITLAQKFQDQQMELLKVRHRKSSAKKTAKQNKHTDQSDPV